MGASKKSIARKSVIASFEHMLSGIGDADVGIFRDMVKDYMQLWEIKELLQTDIRERGVVYKDLSSVGVEMQKNNPSVKELININRQMLVIWDKFGLKPEPAKEGDEDDL
jgi:phage terminase small subunit